MTNTINNSLAQIEYWSMLSGWLVMPKRHLKYISNGLYVPPAKVRRVFRSNVAPYLSKISINTIKLKLFFIRLKCWPIDIFLHLNCIYLDIYAHIKSKLNVVKP